MRWSNINNKDILKKINSKKFFISIISGFALTLLFSVATYNYSEKVQAGIADNILRLHIIANSDEGYDQELKIFLRDEVIAKYSDILSINEDKNKIISTINGRLEEITAFCKSKIVESGYDYDVSVSISRCIFPTKIYGGISIPTGEYDALKIIIGEGSGKNWWCVLFPPLCFVDATHAEFDTESTTELKQILTSDEYDLITKNMNDSNIEYRVKFKIVEMWQELKMFWK